jgi:hypothetical protein
MSLPFPVPTLGPPDLLSVTTGATPPQAPIGWTLLLDPDGRVHGPTTLALHAGDTFALAVEGSLFTSAVPAAGAFYLALPGGPQAVLGQILPGGLDGYPLGIIFRVPGRLTLDAAPGGTASVPAQVRIWCADSASAVSVDLFLALRPSIDVPTLVARGVPASMAYTLTQEDGAPYDLSGMELVWRCGGLSTASPPCALLVLDAAGGQVQVTLPDSQTRRLVAGPAPYQFVDQATGAAVAGGQIQVI